MTYKGYKIQRDNKAFGNYLIFGVGKGNMPKALSGLYTDLVSAKKDIDLYTIRKGSRNAKTNSTTRD